MLATIWNTLLVTPLLNILVLFYHFTGNLGISIILLTLTSKTIMIPIITPSLTAMKKQRELQPELDKIKKKYMYDKKKQAEMQMELFKQHGLNPASGCGTQIIMIIILIALYNVIRRFSMGIDIANLNTSLYFGFLKFTTDQVVNTSFLYLNLAKPDPYYILAILSGMLQFIASKMTLPYATSGEQAAKQTPSKRDDIAYNMQEQMLYTMPIMNFVIGATLPAGVVLYIITSVIFQIVQTYFVSGLGGLKSWVDRFIKIIKKS